MVPFPAAQFTPSATVSVAKQIPEASLAVTSTIDSVSRPQTVTEDLFYNRNRSDKMSKYSFSLIRNC